MEEQRQEEITELTDDTNVVALFGRTHTKREAPPTDEELMEYRRIRPRLLQMLREWDALKSQSGCPVARAIFDSD
jgi:hypothetical protein